MAVVARPAHRVALPQSDQTLGKGPGKEQIAQQLAVVGVPASVDQPAEGGEIRRPDQVGARDAVIGS